MRGWRNERSVKTVDSTGRPVTITTGLTTNAQGHLAVGLAIDGQAETGPSATLPVPAGGRVISNLQLSFDDLAKKTRRP